MAHHDTNFSGDAKVNRDLDALDIEHEPSGLLERLNLHCNQLDVTASMLDDTFSHIVGPRPERKPDAECEPPPTMISQMDRAEKLVHRIVALTSMIRSAL